ncbi:MAG: DUF4062 domain-containing protein [Betaproteobacteria bacterium]|nr:DUF4062 domain-containing protein [Betaproteobacteria bacterium]
MANASVPKVFISSTLEDLGDFRKAAQEAILRLNWQSIDCGYWAAGGNPPLKTCLTKSDDANGDLKLIQIWFDQRSNIDTPQNRVTLRMDQPAGRVEGPTVGTPEA